MESKTRIILSISLAVIFIVLLIISFNILSGKKSFPIENAKITAPLIVEAVKPDLLTVAISPALCDVIVARDLNLCREEIFIDDENEDPENYCVSVLDEVDFIRKTAEGNCGGLNGFQKRVCDGLQNRCSGISGFAKELCDSMRSGNLNACEVDDLTLQRNTPTLGCEVTIGLYNQLIGEEDGCDIASGMNSYLCKSIVANDCTPVYDDVFLDYAYVNIGIQEKNKDICDLVQNPSLRKDCKKGEGDPVEKDLLFSPY